MATYSFSALGFDPAHGDPAAIEAVARDCLRSAQELGVVIQVKSGGSDGISKQIDKSRMVTQTPVVAFAPKMNEARLTWYREHGYTVFRRLSDLLDFLDSQR
jgi:hypothetical protein